MKLQKQNLFATPESFEVLQDWIERHAPEERIHLYTAAGMAWNLACEQANAVIDQLWEETDHEPS